MKLHWSPRSPFVRKVMIALHELGMTDRVELVRSVAAFAAPPNPAILADNPLGKIPVLVTADAKLFDSRVICEYLDGLAPQPVLLPPMSRIAHLRWQALADGLTDILLLWRIERAREEKADPVVLAAFETKTRATLAALEDEPLEGTPFGLGHIAVVCALGQLDFRYAGCGWQKAHPRLAAWQSAQNQRPSVAATAIDDDGAGPAGPDTPAFTYEVN